MGFVEKDRDALTGNHMLIGDLLLTWDEQEPLSPCTKAQEENGAEHSEQGEPSKTGIQPK